jgi:enamine deaminase RidA (YjgF/YER057c/UK114 family)
MGAEARLSDLGLTLPVASAPVANYVPWVLSGSLLILSGQLPLANGQLLAVGQAGKDVSLDDAKAAARQCALNLMAQISAAAGSLDHVARVVRLGGFVASTDGFTDQPAVVNGASDLFVAVFGERGRHARTAVGVNVLPRGTTVEIDAIVELTADGIAAAQQAAG